MAVNGNGLDGSNGSRVNNAGNGKKGKNGKKKMHPALLFALIVFGIVFAFVFVAGIGTLVYISNKTFEEVRSPNVYADTTQSKPGIVKTVRDLFDKVPERTNFIVLGVDDEGGGIRSDTMILGSFNSKSKKIYLVSLPRDVMVSLPKDDIKEYNDLGIYPPSYMKFNEILAYVGKEYGIDAIMKQAESEFGIKLDYFVKIDTQGFRDLIDALGGVEMTLERDYYYYDPDQNLKINLKAGPQRLMGSDAEGLVRFRADYAEGDIKRIRVQQQFLGELFRQTLQKDNLVKNAPSLLRVFLENVTTNCTIAEATKYLQFLPALTSENLEMYSLANDNAESYMYNDLSYIRLDQDHVDEIISLVFFGEGGEVPEDSKGLRIAVLNGSGVSGLAKKTQDELAAEGYNVTKIGDFNGTKQEKDRIFVKKSGYGQDLKEFLNNSEIIQDTASIVSGSDITIVLGTGHHEEE